MKILTCILCLFCLVNRATAQDSTHNTADTAKAPLYVIDNKTDRSINDVKPGDIFRTSILSDTVAAVKLYGQRAINGVVVITTKLLAIKEYQQKLSALSKKYKDYLDKKGNDSNLLYVIDNTMLRAGVNKSIRELYELEPGDIVKVDFKKDRRFKNDATVVITTTAATTN